MAQVNALLTRSEAYGLLRALEEDAWWDGPTTNSHNLVMYIIERDLERDSRGVPSDAMARLGLGKLSRWTDESASAIHPCHRAFTRHDCPHGHDWRPLEDDSLTYVPFGTTGHEADWTF